jgi:hypothetical protein
VSSEKVLIKGIITSIDNIFRYSHALAASSQTWGKIVLSSNCYNINSLSMDDMAGALPSSRYTMLASIRSTRS